MAALHSRIVATHGFYRQILAGLELMLENTCFPALKLFFQNKMENLLPTLLACLVQKVIAFSTNLAGQGFLIGLFAFYSENTFLQSTG